MQQKCVPAGQKGQGQQMGRGSGEGPMGKPMMKQQEMFAADVPGFKKVEKKIDTLVDSAVAECGMGDPGDFNAVQNTPTQDGEEELERVHKDIAGYSDEPDEENEYAGGGADYEDEMIPEEPDIRGTLEQIFQEKGEYQLFFKKMMDDEGITSIGTLSPEQKSSFFSKISAAWKKEKGESVAESFLNEDLGASSAIAGLITLGVIWGPYFVKVRKQKKAAKEQCKKYKGDVFKKCLIKVDIAALKKEFAETKKGFGKCSKSKNPERCRNLLNTITKHYEKKIKEKETKLQQI